MRKFPHPPLAALALLGGAAAVQSAQAIEYATVVSSTPVTASVPSSQQVCSDGQQLVQPRSSGVGAVIGAIAGGVVGNSIGGGIGRAAATGLGAVAGAVAGDQIESNTGAVSEVPVRRCQTVSGSVPRTVGYDVVYDYAGQRYSTRMARDPGRQFAVNVQPAQAEDERLAQPVDSDPAIVGSQPVPMTTYPAATYPATTYPATTYYALPPQPIYYEPLPPAVYIAPAIGFGLGYYGGYGGGWRGGYGGGYRGGYHRHWR